MSGANKGRRSLDTCRDEFTAVVENGKTKMRCNHCRMTISNHTATLKNHLARRHDNGGAMQSYDAPNASRAGDSADNYGKQEEGEEREERNEGEEPQQEASSAAEDQANGPTLGKKDLKKRPQRSSSAQGDDSSVERANQEQRQHDDDASVEEKGVEKKRKVDAVAPDAPVAPVTATTTKEAEKLLPLIDHHEFADMNREMHEHDEMREQIIKRSREILKSRLFQNCVSWQMGIRRCEMAHYQQLLKSMLKRNLLGIISPTIACCRVAICQIYKSQSILVASSISQFDFRNGPLRKKFDSVKYNLRKLENTLYELSLITKLGITVQSHSVDDEPQSRDGDAVV
uniref:BED-type domain-containing protein n=1 Tax=Globisporangium ultimum (strain ATCC 200006 / CBS 805.95 / DAOM BR144) TaxID=431595 RepID=K3X419_GLOUD